MLTNNQKKRIIALQQKKFRKLEGSFIVEGRKLVKELVASDCAIEAIYGTETLNGVDVELIDAKTLKSISSLKNPDNFLAVAKIKEAKSVDFESGLTIALDNISDPGNLGTIIRTADWFGVKQIVCSNDCVDIYNPKVVQASMGAIFRVNIVYSDLSEVLSDSTLTVYGAFMNGENIYSQPSIEIKNAVLLMGNEANGISEGLEQTVDTKITIPKAGESESLNVSTATAILCSEFLRNHLG